MANALENGVRMSQTSPKFLHANSTSHTWIFSAFAELIDNAYDPDVAATQLFIDKKSIQNETCLVYTDNGNGMRAEKLHRMLSFGYCEKVTVNNHKPVGHYGNGFKSGSMRLGKDALVLTKCADSMSVGFLSQTYLEKIKAQTVLVPIVSWNSKTKKLIQNIDTAGSMEAITKHSLFRSERALLAELDALVNFKTGTRIIIYNLTRTSDGNFELDFESNLKDIINSERYEMDFATRMRPVREYQPAYKRSLREYCSILFLKPRMKIILRGEKVITKLVSKSLRETEKDVYKPVWLERPVKITFGFGQSKEDCGLMMYHRNRLIKAFEKVGILRQRSNEGDGVIGIVEVDFLEPVHNKQDFNKTDRYNTCISSLGQKLNDYWMEKTSTPQMVGDIMIIDPDYQTKLPDWTWVQCDNCLKWRRLPDGYSGKDLPKRWFCYMNADPHHSRCDIEEEPEDEDELLMRATYKKTQKNKQLKEKQHKRMNLEGKEKELAQKEQALRNMHSELVRKQRTDQNIPDNKPTTEELDRARHELLAAKKREEEQKRIIQELQKQKKDLETTQHLMQEASKKPHHKNDTSSSNSNNKDNSRKRGGVINTSGLFKSKKPRIEMATPEFVVARNSDSEEEKEDDDDTCIIIDDSDLDKPRRKMSEDVKPDVDELNKEMADKQGKGKSAAGVKPKNTSAPVPPPHPNPIGVRPRGRPPNPNTSFQNGQPPPQFTPRGPRAPMHRLPQPRTPMPRQPLPRLSQQGFNPANQQMRGPMPPPPGPRTSTPRQRAPRNMNMNMNNPPQSFNTVSSAPDPTRTQTAGSNKALEKELRETKERLTTLRMNVSLLLQVILPELEISNNAVIDDIVAEMIKVNKEKEEGSGEETTAKDKEEEKVEIKKEEEESEAPKDTADKDKDKSDKTELEKAIETGSNDKTPEATSPLPSTSQAEMEPMDFSEEQDEPNEELTASVSKAILELDCLNKLADGTMSVEEVQENEDKAPSPQNNAEDTVQTSKKSEDGDDAASSKANDDNDFATSTADEEKLGENSAKSSRQNSLDEAPTSPKGTPIVTPQESRSGKSSRQPSVDEVPTSPKEAPIVTPQESKSGKSSRQTSVDEVPNSPKETPIVTPQESRSGKSSRQASVDDAPDSSKGTPNVTPHESRSQSPQLSKINTMDDETTKSPNSIDPIEKADWEESAKSSTNASPQAGEKADEEGEEDFVVERASSKSPSEHSIPKSRTSSIDASCNSPEMSPSPVHAKEMDDSSNHALSPKETEDSSHSAAPSPLNCVTESEALSNLATVSTVHDAMETDDPGDDATFSPRSREKKPDETSHQDPSVLAAESQGFHCETQGFDAGDDDYNENNQDVFSGVGENANSPTANIDHDKSPTLQATDDLSNAAASPNPGAEDKQCSNSASITGDSWHDDDPEATQDPRSDSPDPHVVNVIEQISRAGVSKYDDPPCAASSPYCDAIEEAAGQSMDGMEDSENEATDKHGDQMEDVLMKEKDVDMEVDEDSQDSMSLLDPASDVPVLINQNTLDRVAESEDSKAAAIMSEREIDVLLSEGNTESRASPFEVVTDKEIQAVRAEQTETESTSLANEMERDMPVVTENETESDGEKSELESETAGGNIEVVKKVDSKMISEESDLDLSIDIENSEESQMENGSLLASEKLLLASKAKS